MRLILALVLGLVIGNQAYAEAPLTLQLLAGKMTQEFDAKRIVPGQGSPGGFTGSGSDTSWGLRGAIFVTKFLSAEFTYLDIGEITDTTTGRNNPNNRFKIKSSSRSLGMGVKGVLPFENGLSLEARFGVTRWDFENDTVNLTNGNRQRLNDEDFTPYYGVGLNYQINDLYSVGLEYLFMADDVEQVSDGIKNESDREIDGFSLSLGRRI